MKRIKKTVTLAACALAPLAASAQLACTMPNGVVITKNFGDCPADAVKIQKPDGTLLPVAPPRPKNAPRPVQRATATAPPAPAPAPAPAALPPNAYEYAQIICRAFEQVGATECEIDSSVFSTSYINATFATSPQRAATACSDVVTAMHKKTSAFGRGNWKIRIYSPFSGTRPIAACNL